MALPLSYNLRNVLVRKLSSGLTFAVVAVLVIVLTVLLSFASGIRESLVATGSRLNVLVLKSGATAESTSIIMPDEEKRVYQVQGVASGRDGRPLFSPELCTQTSIPRVVEGNMANVAVRGVDPPAFEVHDEIRVVEGRVFDPAQLEIVVGRAAARRFEGLSLGGSVQLGRQADKVFKVVGVFEAAGGALESEIWGPRAMIADTYGRRMVSSVVLRMRDADTARAAVEYIDGPAVQLDGKLETEYYYELTSKTGEIVTLTSILIAIMAIGSVFAVANTMYATVDGRRREIAMLRTIGFSRLAILASIVIESLVICLSACATGLLLSLLVNGSRQDFLSDTTWTVLAYELRITPQVVAAALAVGVVVGVVGAMAPAIQASRVRVIEALRKA